MTKQRIGIVLAACLMIGSGVVGLVACTAQERAATAADLAVAQAALVEQEAALLAQQQAADARGDTRAADEARKAIALLATVRGHLAQGQSTLEVSSNPDGSLNIAPAATLIGQAIGGSAGLGVGVLLPLIWQWFSRRRAAATPPQT